MAKPVHLCNHAGCNELIPFDQTYCHKHEYKKPIEYADQKERHQVNKSIYHKRRNSKHESKYLRFYKSKEWRRMSHHWLMLNPLCEDCKKRGIVRKGDVVDHIVELRDNFEKRLDENNLQTLCYSCHNKKTKREKAKREKRKLQNLF